MTYFDASNISPHEEFDLLPEGWYHCVITGSEAHHGRRAESGEMLKLTVEIDADHHPEHAGRRLFSYLCIHHESKTPRVIAQRSLSAICHATEVIPMAAPHDLVGGKLLCRVRVRPPKDGYDASNDIAAWAPLGSKDDMSQVSRASTKAPSAGTAAGAAPRPKPGGWHR